MPGVRSMELLLAKSSRIEIGAHAIMYINIWPCLTALEGVVRPWGLDRVLNLPKLH